MIDAKLIGVRLKEERKKGDWTQQEAAQLVGVSMRSWQEYEAGRVEPTFAVLDKFAEARGISVFMLISGEELAPHDLPLEVDIPIVDHIPAGPPLQSFCEVGIIGSIRADIRDPEAFALVVKGTSMSPEIQEGDVVICSPSRHFVNGKVYAIVLGEGEQSLKRVRREPRARAYALIPSNKEFPTLQVPEEQVIKLVRVVEIRRDLQ